MAKPGGLGIVLDLGKPKMGDDEGDGASSAKQEALEEFFAMGAKKDWAGAEDAFLTLMGICYPDLKHSGEEYDEEGDASEEV